MIHNADGSVTLEPGEQINLQKEVDWIVHDWLPGDRYDGALIFASGDYGRAAGYLLFPYRDGRNPLPAG